MAGMEQILWRNLYDIFDILEDNIRLSRALLTLIRPGNQLYFVISLILLVQIVWKEIVKILISNLDFGASV